MNENVGRKRSIPIGTPAPVSGWVAVHEVDEGVARNEVVAWVLCRTWVQTDCGPEHEAHRVCGLIVVGGQLVSAEDELYSYEDFQGYERVAAESVAT